MNTNPSRRKRLGLLTASFVALSLTAAACGSDSETATSEAVTTVAPVDTTAAPAPETTVATPDTTVDAGAPFGPACSAVPADGEGSFGGMADDPAATAASNNPVLSTLVAAVTAAGLVDTLNGPGPFTIFAPYNDAFAAIPAADLDAVLADKDLLTSILTLHVVAGEKMSSADLITAGTVETINGESLTFTDVDGALTINGSVKSICMDVPTANATVHIIDSVLMPAG